MKKILVLLVLFFAFAFQANAQFGPDDLGKVFGDIQKTVSTVGKYIIPKKLHIPNMSNTWSMYLKVDIAYSNISHIKCDKQEEIDGDNFLIASPLQFVEVEFEPFEQNVKVTIQCTFYLVWDEEINRNGELVEVIRHREMKKNIVWDGWFNRESQSLTVPIYP